MAEVIGVITGLIGLLPVAAQVVSCYRNARTKEAEARVCAKELKAIEVDLEVQEGRGNLEGQVVRAMIEDPLHPLWKDQQLDDCLRACLARSYHVCENVIETIVEILQDIQHGLVSFDLVRSQRVKGKSLRKIFRRLQQSFKISFDRPWYEKKLDRLRNSNQDLEALRSQLYTFQRTQQLAAAPQTPSAPLPQSISRVREVSVETHKAITETFSSDDTSHVSYAAALCVNAETEDSAGEQLSFDMAISFNSSVGL
ncbi:hypothetical protein QQZ08_008758 [Neonectria magnoliae]|uniref:Fungal N-terminal domain-containing protein n=1 Tax=Neonectria magnoliae TaxID=2732573 RepID=A0ABR1HSF8_9HYPO